MKSTHHDAIALPPGLVCLQAAGIADPDAPREGPGALLLEIAPGGPTGLPWPVVGAIRVLAIGRPSEVAAHPAAPHAARVNLPDTILLPGLVNAHTHLDLTHLGPLPHRPEDGFVAWVDRVRSGRAQEAAAIAGSVAQGVALSLRAGVVLVGDIAGAPGGRPSLTPLHTLAASPLRGVSFLEFFAIGLRERESVGRMECLVREAAPAARTGGARLGLQPHAPNTVGPRAYQAAARLAEEFDLPLSTHLAETPEEREFVAQATGSQRSMLERFGLWTDEILRDIGHGRTPIEHLARALAGIQRSSGILTAHVNDLGDEPEHAIGMLASMRASVAYCPRASAYFNAPAHFGAHRYQDMMAAGINLCLGTDSILNLPEGVDAPDGSGLSVLDEARLLWRRDRTDPTVLLRMLTTNGAAALGWNADHFRLNAGARPLAVCGVRVGPESCAKPPIERALHASTPARLLALSV
ncbi:MAG: amidohydrolase family protein [Phycisphaerales bacterium]|nr:amidohydrolase family protein [Phycisphaerales bacterium]